MDNLSNKRVTVAGLGRFGGGIAVSKWLAAQGAQVLVTDKDSAEKLADSVKQLAGLPIEFRLGEHRVEDFTSADLVVISPAIPPHNEFLRAAKTARVPVTLEIQLFIERCPAKIVGITATKGKSTTTAMLGAMLRKSHTVHVGGNLGGSLLFDLPRILASDLVVLELSSYMLAHLEPMKWSPHVAVVGMIGRDHLEWHGGEEAYVDAKRNIVRFQSPTDVAVLNEENLTACGFADVTRAKILPAGTKNRRPFDLLVAGAHNQLNAQLAFRAASALGISRDAAQSALHDFVGLPHRLQLVHESGGVKWINDSIATIPEAAVVAMESFPRGKVIQIVGGYDKHLDMRAMCETLARNCKAVLTIGAIGPQLADMVRQAPGQSSELHECGDLAAAVATAKKLSQSGDVILLSTGCASYDQFVNFEARGEAFAKLAKQNHAD